MTGTLYVVATPIGDPTDLSERAKSILVGVDRIAAEDTRTLRALLRRVGLDREGVSSPVLVSYHDHNETDRTVALLAALGNGERIALVSDAGTPLIADPGFRIVRAATEAGARVVVVPGPCAAVGALSGSGLPAHPFVFLGFFPRDPGPRAELLRERRFERGSLVAYEAPHRLLETLDAARAAWGDRPVAAACNLTKPTEAWYRGTLGAVAAELRALDEVRGEWTLVFGGCTDPTDAEQNARVDALIAGLVEAGVPIQVVRDVVARVYDLPRREVYQRALAARGPR